MHSYVIFCKSGGINFKWSITWWLTNPKSTYVIFSDQITSKFNIIGRSKAMWFAEKSTLLIFNSNTQFRWKRFNAIWSVKNVHVSISARSQSCRERITFNKRIQGFITQLITQQTQHNTNRWTQFPWWQLNSDGNRDSSDSLWDQVVLICSEPSIMKFANQLYPTENIQFSLSVLRCLYEWTLYPTCLGKYIWNSHDPNTNLELNTRTFTRPFAYIPFIPVGRTKECQEYAHIVNKVSPTLYKL